MQLILLFAVVNTWNLLRLARQHVLDIDDPYLYSLLQFDDTLTSCFGQ